MRCSNDDIHGWQSIQTVAIDGHDIKWKTNACFNEGGGGDRAWRHFRKLA
jgi:hypothetical protein